MGKTSGSTRTSSAGAPRGLTEAQQNVALFTSGTPFPRYQDTDEWKSENVDRLFSEAVTEINRAFIESGDRFARAQLTWNGYGDRAIRIINGRRGRTGIDSPAGRAIYDLEEKLVNELGVPRRAISTLSLRVRGITGVVYYLSFDGWKGGRD